MILALGIAGLLPSASAFAVAIVSESQGDVRIGATRAESRPAAPGQRVPAGSLVSTASGARVILRFDDGQLAALHENTQLRIEGFRYRLEEPAADRAAFVLLRGALRIITGALGQRNPAAFTLRTTETTVGVRGTDFMVAIVNPVYLSVLQGSISATNAAGTALFEAGAYGTVASRTRLAVTVRESALPGAAASAFRGLGALPIAAGAIQLPERAVAQPQDSAAFGRETADKARALKQDLDRKMKAGAADAARERAREAGPASRPGPGRP